MPGALRIASRSATLSDVSTKRQGSSIWIFVAGFLALAVLGIAFLLIIGSPLGDTKPASDPFWEADNSSGSPAGGADKTDKSGDRGDTGSDGGTKVVTDPDSREPADPSGTTTPGGTDRTSGPSSTPVTYPGGEPAPDDATEVLRSDGTTSISFRLGRDPLGEKLQALVPPMKTKVSKDSSSITVWISCAQSSRESLAQVSVSETDRQLTVAAVVLVPPNSIGCNSSAAPRELVIPLESPVGNRAVVTTPAYTKLPDIKQD